MQMILMLAGIIISILLIIAFIIDKLTSRKYESDLKILGLDILKSSHINFVLSPYNHIYLMIFSRIFNGEACDRTKELAKLINAELKIKSGYIEWFVDGKLIHKSSHNDFIILMPCGDIINYERRKNFTVDCGKTQINGVLKSAENNKFELRNINQTGSLVYKIIDIFDWS